MPKLCIKPNISETMNVKGHRRCVTVVYPPSYQYFKIPDGVDLNDLTVVREWFVRDDILNIHFKDSNKDSIFEQPHYTDIYGGPSASLCQVELGDAKNFKVGDLVYFWRCDMFGVVLEILDVETGNDLMWYKVGYTDGRTIFNEEREIELAQLLLKDYFKSKKKMNK